MIIQFIITFLILGLLWLYLSQNRKKNLEYIFEEASFVDNIHKNKNIENILSSCQVPNLNTEQCYKSKYFECPITNGSYSQCTNNYIPSPDEFNSDCSNRTFEMVPYPRKISENCYYNKINFDKNKKYIKVK
jgi:hypothetical protein